MLAYFFHSNKEEKIATNSKKRSKKLFKISTKKESKIDSNDQQRIPTATHSDSNTSTINKTKAIANGSVDNRSLNREGLLDYFQDQRIRINNQEYLLSEELFSLSKNDFEEDFGQQLYEDQQSIYFLPAEGFSGNYQLAFYNPRKQRLARSTGKIILNNLDSTKIKSLSLKFGFRFSNEMAHLNTYLITPGQNESALSLYEQLEQSGHRPELELIERGFYAK